MNIDIIEKATEQILYDGLGLSRNDAGIKDTPKRVAKAYEHWCSGYSQDPKEILKTQFDSENFDDIVLLKDIEMYSMCEHHMVPFFGHYYFIKDRLC